MQYRSLGNSGISVSPMMLGANVFGWTIDEKTSFSVLDACIDQGINFIDTADVYSAWVPGLQGGESETIIGKWFKKSGRRQSVVLATKVGYLAARKGLSASNIHKAVEESLQRLQTDCIDVYFSHVDDDSVPMEETLTAYEKLLKDGKIRAIGASNFSAGRLEEVLASAREHGLPRYQVLQPEYNLYDRAAYEGGLERVAQEHDLAVVSYYGLARGFLSGKYRSAEDTQASARGAGMAKYMNPRGFSIVDTLSDIAAKHHVSAAAVALAWVRSRPSITAPIASATSLKQLSDLVAASQLTLDPEDMAALDAVSA